MYSTTIKMVIAEQREKATIVYYTERKKEQEMRARGTEIEGRTRRKRHREELWERRGERPADGNTCEG
jgi:hypothetical protein